MRPWMSSAKSDGVKATGLERDPNARKALLASYRMPLSGDVALERPSCATTSTSTMRFEAWSDRTHKPKTTFWEGSARTATRKHVTSSRRPHSFTRPQVSTHNEGSHRRG